MPVRLVAVCLVVLGAGSAAAEVVAGRLARDGDGLALEAGDERLALADTPLAGELAPFAGREVELDVDRVDGRLVVARILSPARAAVDGVVAERADGALALEADDGAVLALEGPRAEPLLRPLLGERVTVDAWRLAGAARVEGVEHSTVSKWVTVLYRDPGALPIPVDLIRSRRAVWVTARQDGHVRVRTGDHAGWVRPGRVALASPPEPEPTPADLDGLSDLVPPGD